MYFQVGLLASKKSKKNEPLFFAKNFRQSDDFSRMHTFKRIQVKTSLPTLEERIEQFAPCYAITFPDKQMTLVEGFKRLIMATQHQKPASHLLVYAKVLVLVVVDWVQHKKSTLFYHPCGMPHPKDSAQNLGLRLSFSIFDRALSILVFDYLETPKVLHV